MRLRASTSSGVALPHTWATSAKEWLEGNSARTRPTKIPTANL